MPDAGAQPAYKDCPYWKRACTPSEMQLYEKLRLGHLEAWKDLRTCGCLDVGVHRKPQILNFNRTWVYIR